MQTKAIFPGTFDPLTFGHLELIHRAAKLFDHLIVGLGENLSKKPHLSLDERMKGLKEELYSLSNVEVISFSGLVTDFAKEQKAHILLRGIRSPSDWEYEMQMARANRIIGDIETVFLAAESQSQISSSLIRELAMHKASLKNFIPERFERMIYKHKD